MNTLIRARSALLRTMQEASAQWRRDPDRGDVPGWVLITIMSAGLVAALWLVAEPLLAGLFTDAVSGVTGP